MGILGEGTVDELDAGGRDRFRKLVLKCAPGLSREADRVGHLGQRPSARNSALLREVDALLQFFLRRRDLVHQFGARKDVDRLLLAR